MAGDWIKMRVDLALDPAVIAISGECQIEEDMVVGKLHKLWSWADQQTEDGNAPSVTLSWIDRYICVTGFAQAMQNAGWLVVSGSGFCFPDFDKHNGKTAKTRALTAKRVKRKRNGVSVTHALPDKREDKREEKKKPPTPFVPDLIAKVHDGEPFAAAWSDFCQHRREIRKPLTPRAAIGAMAMLEQMPADRAIAALRHTVAMGWQGIREPEVKRSQHPPAAKQPQTAADIMRLLED